MSKSHHFHTRKIASETSPPKWAASENPIHRIKAILHQRTDSVTPPQKNTPASLYINIGVTNNEASKHGLLIKFKYIFLSLKYTC